MPLGFLKSVFQKITGCSVHWEEWEEILIQADLGPQTARAIIQELKRRGTPVSSQEVLAVTREKISQYFPAATSEWTPFPDRPYVVLLVGVNGTGKTTSAAKIAHYLKSRNHSVRLVAADTFRAGAIEQLQVWGKRLEIEVMSSQYGGDAAALCYDAYASAKRQGIQFLVCDTAGRIHTKSNLMQELSKVGRILSRQDPQAPHQRLLVLDATTGLNALIQAQEFHKSIPLTGSVITKLDGSGKGGIAVAISQQLGIAPQFVGTGERLTDWERFDCKRFVEEMV